MEHTLGSCTVETFIDRFEKERLNFDFALQRDGNQWNKEQKSLLIHSVLTNMMIPSVYLLKKEDEEGESWVVIDGKQRLTNLISFCKNEFRIGKNIPSVTMNGTEYDISGRKYGNLPECLKEKLKMRMLDIVFLFNYTEKEIEDQFYRLNNVSIFTKQQKATVKLGNELAVLLSPLEHHPFWDRVNISDIQKRHGIIMETILKSLMLLTDYSYNHFGAAEVIKFAEYYSKNYNPQEIKYFTELLNKLDRCVINEEEVNEVLKPINIPIFIMNLDHFESFGKSEDKYEQFITHWCRNEIKNSEYQHFCGAGSTNRNKVWGRMETMDKALDMFIEGNSGEAEAKAS